MTANTFGIHQCTVSIVVFEVCDAITKHLGPQYIHLPTTEEEMQRKVSEFELKFGMIHAFGCIDGTHMHISMSTTGLFDLVGRFRLVDWCEEHEGGKEGLPSSDD